MILSNLLVLLVFFFYNELLPLLMLSSVCLLSNLIRGFFCLYVNYDFCIKEK